MKRLGGRGTVKASGSSSEGISASNVGRAQDMTTRRSFEILSRLSLSAQQAAIDFHSHGCHKEKKINLLLT